MSIEEFFTKYTRAYNEQNLQAAIDSYLLPSIMINEHRMAKFTCVDDLRKEYEFTFDMMKKQQISHFEMIRVESTMLCSNQYIASAVWRACINNGNNMDFGSTYMLVVEDGELKISTAMVHPQGAVLALNMLKLTPSVECTQPVGS